MILTIAYIKKLLYFCSEIHKRVLNSITIRFITQMYNTKKIKTMKEIYFVMTWVNGKPNGVSKYVFNTRELAEAHARELCKQNENMTYQVNPLFVIS